MKRILFSLFALIVCVTLYAEKERRVYYLDCSYSMVRPNKIWNAVCDNLIKAIENIEDETTEIYVIPFAVDGLFRNTLDAYIEQATPSGKESEKK